jgi:outer membrane lipoprotein-sorting protein
VSSQEIVTADKYLEKVSAKYATFHDYQAQITIKTGRDTMTGIVSHLEPDFLRIDFTNPTDQVIVFNGTLLTVYLPQYKAALNQNVDTASGNRNTAMGLATSSGGLSMLRRNYAAAFITGPDPVPLDDPSVQGGSQELVVKIRLTRRYGTEDFRQITLSINPNTLLIRRMEAVTTTNTSLSFDFTNIKTNIGIPEERFLYDSPPTANMYNNFLFRDSN